MAEVLEYPMRELLEIMHNGNQHLLLELLQQSPVEEHQAITLQYARLMGQLVDYCKAGLLEADGLTTGFICGLHRLLYPEGHTCAAQDAEGNTVLMYPGQYKLLQQAAINRAGPGSLSVFMPPEETPQAMEAIVATLEGQLRTSKDAEKKRDAIIVFALEYLLIHPFFDGNGRVACILTDLLLLRERLPLLNMSSVYRHSPQIKQELILVVSEVRRTRDLAPLYSFIASYRPMPDKGESSSWPLT